MADFIESGVTANLVSKRRNPPKDIVLAIPALDSLRSDLTPLRSNHEKYLKRHVSPGNNSGQSSLEAAMILASILAFSGIAYAIGHTHGFRAGYSEARSYFSANPTAVCTVSSNKFESAYKP